MTLPLISLRCNRCGCSQSGGYMGPRAYELPDGKTLPIHSQAGWCRDCGQLESMENIDPDLWLNEITEIQEQVASVQAQKKWRGLSWKFSRKFLGHLGQEDVTEETFTTWANELHRAVIGFRVMSSRKSPPRCLRCGSVRVEPAEYLSDPESPDSRKLIHRGCGGTLETIFDGDIFLPRGLRHVRLYSIEGELIGTFEKDKETVTQRNRRSRGKWLERLAEFLRKHAD